MYAGRVNSRPDYVRCGFSQFLRPDGHNFSIRRRLLSTSSAPVHNPSIFPYLGVVLSELLVIPQNKPLKDRHKLGGFRNFERRHHSVGSQYFFTHR